MKVLIVSMLFFKIYRTPNHMKEKGIVASFDAIILCMKQQRERGDYHLLLANLKLCIHLVAQKNIVISSDLLANFLLFFTSIDNAAGEFYFREYFSKNYVQELYKLLCEKLSAEQRTALGFDNFFNHLIYDVLPDSQYGKVKLTKFNEQNEFSFKSFLQSEKNTRFNTLKEKHGSRVNPLANNTRRNQPLFLSEVVISYWKTLSIVYPVLFKQADKSPLIELGEGLYTYIIHSPQANQSIWHYLLVLQQLLDEPDMFRLENPEAVSRLAGPGGTFQAALLLNQIADKVNRTKDEGEQLAWINQAISLNHSLKSQGLPKQNCALFADKKSNLQSSRSYFSDVKLSIFTAQKEHTEKVLNLLQQFIRIAADFLGSAPCDVAFCALGSSSRYDRRPYSDVEFLVLYEPHSQVRQEHVDVYVFQLISLVEMQIICLGETHYRQLTDVQHNAGFHVDTSCHVFSKGTWGTPSSMVKKFIVKSIKNLGMREGHAWLSDESFYALLQPIVINTHHLNSDHVFQAYQAHVQAFLYQAFSPLTDNVEALSHDLSLAQGVLIGLRRHQVIAAACLFDVLSKSVALIKATSSGAVIDIKQAYYKPVAYLALNLKLFYGMKEKFHPADLLEAIKNGWEFGEPIVQLFQTVLAFVGQQQIDLHLSAGHQEEEMVYQRYANAQDKIFWSGCDLIFKGILLPLKQALSIWLDQPSEDFKGILLSSFKVYLNQRKVWLTHWKNEGFSTEVLLNHPLILPLETYPALDGWSPYYEKTQIAIEAKWSLLATEKPSHCLMEGLPNDQNLKGSYLHPTLVEQCFNEKGEFKGLSEYSSKDSQVRVVIWKGYNFFLKVKPGNQEGLMGREFAVQQLHLLLGGSAQVALGCPLKLTFSSPQCRTPKTYWVWLSEEAKGNTLAQVMQNAPHLLQADAIEITNYTQLFLLAYLTAPEDGQPANFKVQLIGENKVRLLAFDMGQSFVSSHRKEGNTKEFLSVKTMIYLLDSIQSPLSATILTYLKLVEPKALYQRWQEMLKDLNQRFHPVALVDLHEMVQQSVYERLRLAQAWVTSSEQTKTGLNFLKALEPALAFSYQALLGKIRTPEAFYAIDPKAYVKDKKTGKVYSSATFKQIQTQTLTPEKLQISLNLTPDYFKELDFSDMKVGDQVDHKRQKFVFDLLKATAKLGRKPFKTLCLSGCSVASESDLVGLLKCMPELKSITLKGMPQLGGNLLDSIRQHCPHVEEVHLENLQGIVSLVQKSVSELKQLVVVHCPTLKMIDVLSPIHFFKVVDCLALKKVEIRLPRGFVSALETCWLENLPQLSLANIQKIFTEHPQIRCLQLIRLPLLALGVDHIVKHLSRLKQVKFEHLPKLTASSAILPLLDKLNYTVQSCPLVVECLLNDTERSYQEKRYPETMVLCDFLIQIDASCSKAFYWRGMSRILNVQDKEGDDKGSDLSQLDYIEAKNDLFQASLYEASTMQPEESLRKFAVPCWFNGNRSPVTIYIGEENQQGAVTLQTRWLKAYRGGVVPTEVIDSLNQLDVLALKNTVSFPELCAYALEEASKTAEQPTETNTTQTTESETVATQTVEKRSDDFLAHQNRDALLQKLYQELIHEYQQLPDDGLACYRLGYLYENGLGIPTDLKKARHMYQRSVALGSLDGRYRLKTYKAAGLAMLPKDNAPLKNNTLYLSTHIESGESHLFYQIKGCDTPFAVTVADANHDAEFMTRVITTINTGELTQITDTDKKWLLHLAFQRDHVLLEEGTSKEQETMLALELAEQGYDTDENNAFYQLSVVYDTSRIGRKVVYDSIQQAEQKIRDHQADALTENRLGFLLAFLNVKDDPAVYERAGDLLMKAARKGLGAAYYHLGKLGKHQRLPLSAEVIAHYFLRGANKGHMLSQYEIGWRYVNGEGVPQDYTQGVYFLTSAAQQGHGDAQSWLAYRYIMGQGVIQNFGTAVYWFKQSILLRHDQDACGEELEKIAEIWNIYFKDKSAAYPYYLAAAIKKRSPSIAIVAKYHLMGWNNLPPNPLLSEALFQKALQWDDCNGYANYHLGRIYQQGLGVAADSAKSQSHYQAAYRRYEDRAKEKFDAVAYYRLGQFYQQGCGVEVNEALAIAYYLKSVRLAQTPNRYQYDLYTTDYIRHAQKKLQRLPLASHLRVLDQSFRILQQGLTTLIQLENSPHPSAWQAVVNWMETISKPVSVTWNDSPDRYLAWVSADWDQVVDLNCLFLTLNPLGITWINCKDALTEERLAALSEFNPPFQWLNCEAATQLTRKGIVDFIRHNSHIVSLKLPESLCANRDWLDLGFRYPLSHYFTCDVQTHKIKLRQKPHENLSMIAAMQILTRCQRSIQLLFPQVTLTLNTNKLTLTISIASAENFSLVHDFLKAVSFSHAFGQPRFWLFNQLQTPQALALHQKIFSDLQRSSCQINIPIAIEDAKLLKKMVK